MDKEKIIKLLKEAQKYNILRLTKEGAMNYHCETAVILEDKIKNNKKITKKDENRIIDMIQAIGYAKDIQKERIKDNVII
jgi:hypothetical protein